jgi:GH15 family glucan-1,4-alpha-glucosidase
MVYGEPKLSDYSLIGNSCSAALVSKYGSIDWCCSPEFHSPSIFAALLDRKKGGHFSIAPVDQYESTQQYIADTNVVQSTFSIHRDTVHLTDAYIAMDEEDKTSSLFPDNEILRVIEGISGTVRIRMTYSPRLLYGKKKPSLTDNGNFGIQFAWKENIFVLQSSLDPGKFSRKSESDIVAEFDVKKGERVFFSLSYSSQSPAILPELKQTAWHRLQLTVNYWRNWIAKCKYSGFYYEHLRRSALILKLLAHAPSGSIIAAPTTSLPEKIGGERNWDYRYCWLRDASFTTRALVKLGFEAEVHAYMGWILHATRLTQPKLQVVYSVYGQANLDEQTLDWLSGYKNSKPVRIGNKADAQFQLDVYGEVLDAVYAYAPLVKEFDISSRKFIIGLGKVICEMWNQPDNGIWEIRSQPVHHTHSKIMAWAGLDRLLKLCRKYNWTDAPTKMFEATAQLIRDQIEQFSYNILQKSYTRELNGQHLDASLLVMPLVDFCSVTSPRMMSTVDQIIKRLSKNNLVYRYRNIEDGVEGDEGSFAICNFWLVENLAQSGRTDEAIKVFETTLKCASPSGLLSEQIDPESFELLGNYPQGFTHIGLINAAISINEALKKKKIKYEFS